MTKLRQQLMLSYLPLILVPVLLVGVVTRDVAKRGLNVFVTKGQTQLAYSMAHCLSAYYEEHNTWEGFFDRSPAQVFFWAPRHDLRVIFVSGDVVNNRDCYPADPLLPPPASNNTPLLRGLSLLSPIVNSFIPKDQPDDRRSSEQAANNAPSLSNFSLQDIRAHYKPGDILISDPNGIVIAGNRAESVGQKLSPETLTEGAPIVVSGKTVATLVVGPDLSALAQQQQEPLNAVSLALVASGAVSVALAIGSGWWLSWQITQPVQRLTAGVKRLATGAWSTPVEVHTHNEFGDLTHAFNKMAGEITHQQRLNRQMVADIAHDLRTPLSAMALEIESIEAGFQTPADATASLREEITWLQHLVDDLRLLSLMDADQIHLQMEETDLNFFLGGVLDFWQTMADETGRCLNFEMDANLPTVCIDPNRMRQVLGNLIDNALRHTKPGQQIRLGARTEANTVAILIADDGEGIAPEDLPHIFDRFYRADPSRTHRDNGSGLGLSIANRLIEMHRGTISVVSTPGQGSTFKITLPRTGPLPPR